ncbi:MAG: beta-lactamase family protein, partial [Lachnospiraceae bacterium]|nr:beta-lactamase family protein [Lachnospiraceae bacterium]
MKHSNEPYVKCAECDTSPSEVAYDALCLDHLNKHIQSLIDEGRIRSGSYCMLRHGKVFADAAIGNIACEWMGNTEFMPDTLFEIQSVGKAITAIAVLKLLDDGLLYPDQPVAELIKEFDTGDFKKITIKHLLTHTSGLCALDGSYPQDERRWWDHMDPADPAGSWLSALVKTGLHAA